MQSQLSKEEYEEYNKIATTKNLQSQQAALQLCLQYYQTYKKFTLVPSDKIGLAIKCAYFMAEKSQYSVTVQGHTIRGFSFSLNSLLKEYKLDDMMFMLKEMTKKAKFTDQQTGVYLNNLVKEISFLITLYSKFEKTFTQKLDLKQRDKAGESSYVRTFTSFAWLLYVLSKQQLLHNSLELLPNTCMIAAIISSILILAWDTLKPEGLLKGQKCLNDKKIARESSMLIKERILEIFCIKDIHEYTKIVKLYDSYFNKMIDSGFLKMSEGKLDMFNPLHLNSNYQKLDKYYEAKLKDNHDKLDERILFKDRTMNLTPSKFTPFARQGYANKFQKQPIGGKLGFTKTSKQQTFNSHRILNYEAAERETEARQMPIGEIKLPKNIMQSPSMVKVPLIVTTPISAGMEMYNFLIEKKKRLSSIKQQERSLDKQIISIIDSVFNLDRKENETSISTKKQMIVSLYKIYSEDYLAANPQEKDTPQLLKAFLGLSIELVFFVSNISLTFEQIEEVIKFSSLEMWKVLHYFLNCDKSMPQAIKLHFLDLEVNLISYKLWQSGQMISKLNNHVNKSSKYAKEEETKIVEQIFRRTLHQIAFQILRLSSYLEIEEPISQKFFDTMKEILANHSNLLYNRHLDQLIVCCTYVLSKTPSRSIKFTEIKDKYAETNPHIKQQDIENMLGFVYIEQDKYEDIIYFYNKVFLKNEALVDFIKNKSKKSTGATQIHPHYKNNDYLNSPLRQIIPKQSTLKSKNFNVKNKNGMTPQNQLLFAYNESPILKYDITSFRGNLKANKALNYEQLENKLNHKSSEQDPMATVSKQNPTQAIFNHKNTSQMTVDFISKKFGKKSTTPTNQQVPTQTFLSQSPMQMNYQTKSKQNLIPLSSHRTLFEEKREHVREYSDHGFVAQTRSTRPSRGQI